MRFEEIGKGIHFAEGLGPEVKFKQVPINTDQRADDDLCVCVLISHQ